MNKSANDQPAPPQLSTAQAVEHLNETHKPKPSAAVPIDTAAVLIAALTSIQSLDHKIAELQIQLDQFPALEADLANDRTKPPAEIRAGLTALRDQAFDLKVEQKRLADDRAKILAGAVARFPAGRQLVSAHFNGLYQAEKAKALAAVAPFFVGSTAHAPQMLDHLPSVSLAATHAAYSQERVKGESPEDTLIKFVAVIKECGLHEPQAA